MSKVFQIFLIFLLSLIIIIFYRLYFYSNQNLPGETVNTKVSEANSIKNLKYELKVENDKTFIITSKSSALLTDNDIEIIFMNEVVATVSNNDGVLLTITSKNADFNTLNYNTKFYNNVKVKYLDNNIHSEKMSLNFQERNILISEDVKYLGPLGVVRTDNAKINMDLNQVNLYMNNTKKNVEIISK